MGKTMIEKIIQLHTEENVEAGKIVWMDLDIRSARDFGGPNVVKNFRSEYGDEPVADREKTFFTFDLSTPASLMKYADNQQICRDFAREQRIKVYDVDRGIGSHVLMEEGLAAPNSTVVGTDSHLNILGAVGSFGQGMGDVDITFAFKTGRAWFEIPQTIKVILHGEVSPPASAKDLTLFILKKLGTEKAALRSIEFYGGAAKKLSLAGRITLCSMVTEMAGIIGFVPEYEESLWKEVEEFSGTRFDPVQPDADGSYTEIVEIDLDGLSPQVAVPHAPTNVFDIADLKGTRIDSGFIGSCTNGRCEDFLEAYSILKGKKVKEGIMLKVVPATKRVYKELLENGVLGGLFESGAIINSPGCGGCAEGMVGLTGEGEVQVSTGNRNFVGKQGKGETYLASPAVAAASCLLGQIAHPEDV